MKSRKLTIIGMLVFLFLIGSQASAQNFAAGEYYSRKFNIQEAPVSAVYPKYDFHGNYLGLYQVWKRARWYREDGGAHVSVWNGNNWQIQWRNGWYYWFDWIDYERYVGF